jgi:hypothetical protein
MGRGQEFLGLILLVGLIIFVYGISYEAMTSAPDARLSPSESYLPMKFAITTANQFVNAPDNGVGVKTKVGSYNAIVYFKSMEDYRRLMSPNRMLEIDLNKIKYAYGIDENGQQFLVTGSLKNAIDDTKRTGCNDEAVREIVETEDGTEIGVSFLVTTNCN